MSGASQFVPGRAARVRSIDTQDRRDWWRGYEDGYTGAPSKTTGSAYLRGYQEGAAAAQRRAALELHKGRDEARRDAAPALLARLTKALASGEEPQ